MELRLTEKREHYRRKTSMEQIEDKGPPKEIGKSHQRSKQTKSCKIISNELSVVGITHAKEKSHI